MLREEEELRSKMEEKMLLLPPGENLGSRDVTDTNPIDPSPPTSA